MKPTIGDLSEKEGEPFVVGEGSAAVTVRAIPGLKYELRRADIVEAFCAAETAPPQKVVCETVATGAMVTLTDTEPPEGAAFYRVEVSVP